MSGIGTVR